MSWVDFLIDILHEKVGHSMQFYMTTHVGAKLHDLVCQNLSLCTAEMNSRELW